MSVSPRAFAFVQPRKFDRRTKGRDTFSGNDSAEVHVLRQLEKTIFGPATRCNHKEMRIDSHGASASDTPMPTTRCPKSARRRKRLALCSWRTTQKPSRTGTANPGTQHRADLDGRGQGLHVGLSLRPRGAPTPPNFSHQLPARQIVVRDENRHFGPFRPGSFPVAIFGDSIDEHVVTAARQV